MPKSKTKISINLDLLKPQSNPEKITVKLIRWLLSTGKFVFIFVEALVLIAFGARFKLDADLAANKEAIEQQIPYIESLKPYETLIKQTQFKLATINAFRVTASDYSSVLKKISNQIPQGVTIVNLNLSKDVNKVTIQINAQAPNNNDLNSFLLGLKSDTFFSNVNLSSIDLDKNSYNFTISANAQNKVGTQL